jgi:hypothetical protein
MCLNISEVVTSLPSIFLFPQAFVLISDFYEYTLVKTYSITNVYACIYS